MNQKAKTIHKLYSVAFGQLAERANLFGKTLKAIAQSEGYSGKVLRRGTPGAYGQPGWFPVTPWPARTGRFPRTKTCAGNARQRRFFRRHPHHFAPVTKEA